MGETMTMGYDHRIRDIDGLYLAIEKDPEMLQKIDKIQFVNTPLHEAAAMGDTSFAIEIMNLMPSFGKKLNPEGLSPLHVAIETGHFDTAQALVEIDKQLVCVKGKEGLTPLHCAAKIPNDHGLVLLAGFLLACPDSIDVLNNRFQTAIHVALENGNCPAISLLVRWLIRRSRESLLSWKDDKGNTALHTAAQYGCRTDQKDEQVVGKEIVLYVGQDSQDLSSDPSTLVLKKIEEIRSSVINPPPILVAPAEDNAAFKVMSIVARKSWAELTEEPYLQSSTAAFETQNSPKNPNTMAKDQTRKSTRNKRPTFKLRL